MNGFRVQNTHKRKCSREAIKLVISELEGVETKTQRDRKILHYKEQLELCEADKR